VVVEVELLMRVIEAAFTIALVILIVLLLYALSLKATRGLSRSVGDKRKPFACGEVLPESKTGLPDPHVYTAVWRDVFKSLYRGLRDKLHTGVLSDWLVWMFIFMVIVVVVLVVV